MMPKTREEDPFERRRDCSWKKPGQGTTQSAPGVLIHDV